MKMWNRKKAEAQGIKKLFTTILKRLIEASKERLQSRR
jgi:hypothetical protein